MGAAKFPSAEGVKFDVDRQGFGKAFHGMQSMSHCSMRGINHMATDPRNHGTHE